MGLEFEWDHAKAGANFQKHGVAFELAKSTFRDAFAIERIDDREDYREERCVLIGMSELGVLLVYTERGDKVRIISARQATEHERNEYFQQNAQTDDARRN